jgi:hypothetical protein
VLHSWGSALTHHPHVHIIVPGGGISLDGERWIPCRPGFFLPVRVLSQLFRRLFLAKLVAAHDAGRLSGTRIASLEGSSCRPSRRLPVTAAEVVAAFGEFATVGTRTGLLIMCKPSSSTW